MSDIFTLTRKKASPAPIFVTDVAKELKSVGASIWLILKPTYGFVIRCEFDQKQFRLILPSLTGNNDEIPNEGRTPTHIVSDLPSLRTWLQSLLA